MHRAALVIIETSCFLCKHMKVKKQTYTLKRNDILPSIIISSVKEQIALRNCHKPDPQFLMSIPLHCTYFTVSDFYTIGHRA
jgi:hypothetical protein